MVSILIVDDDHFVHHVIGRLLISHGYPNIERAFDGAEAIQMYSSLSIKPDIILMDHRMPMMNGTSATRAILEMNPSQRILFVSADESVIQEALDAGAIGFLIKPIRAIQLLEAIEKAMNESVMSEAA